MKWWQYLDWSRMEFTFRKLRKKCKEKMLKEAYWSLGKGKFEEVKNP